MLFIKKVRLTLWKPRIGFEFQSTAGLGRFYSIHLDKRLESDLLTKNLPPPHHFLKKWFPLSLSLSLSEWTEWSEGNVLSPFLNEQGQHEVWDVKRLYYPIQQYIYLQFCLSRLEFSQQNCIAIIKSESWALYSPLLYRLKVQPAKLRMMWCGGHTLTLSYLDLDNFLFCWIFNNLN